MFFHIFYSWARNSQRMQRDRYIDAATDLLITIKKRRAESNKCLIFECIAVELQIQLFPAVCCIAHFICLNKNSH